MIHALVYTATCEEVLAPVIAALRERGAKVGVTAGAPTLMEHYATTEACEAFLASTRPGRGLLVVADSDHPLHEPGRTLTLRARQAGIATFSLQGGSWSNPAKSIDATTVAEHRLCWGDWWAKRFPGPTVALGCPRLVDDGYRWSGHHPVALLAMSTHEYKQYEVWDDHRVVDFLIAVMSGIYDAGYELIVRPHPAEHIWDRWPLYREAADRAHVDVAMWSDYWDTHGADLCGLLASVDAVATQSSTCGLLGLGMGTPGLGIGYIDLRAIKTRFPYEDGHHYRRICPTFVNVHREIEAAMRAMPSRADIAETVGAHVEPYLMPGDGAGRMADYILGVLG